MTATLTAEIDLDDLDFDLDETTEYESCPTCANEWAIVCPSCHGALGDQHSCAACDEDPDACDCPACDNSGMACCPDPACTNR